MSDHLVVLGTPQQRDVAMRYINSAPENTTVRFVPPSRTISQNNKLWALLSDISRAKPQGLRYTPDQWKSLFMHALKYEIVYMDGIDGEPFPVGFKTSKLSKGQMSELIEFIYKWGTEREVEFTI